MCKKNLLLLFCVCLCGLLLTSCGILEAGVEESANIELSNYTERFSSEQGELPPGVSTYGLFVSQNAETDMQGKTIILDDVRSPIYFTCSHRGPTDILSLTIYYDYKQIPFSVADSDQLHYSYRFQLEDNQEINIPIILNGLSLDENRHKLLFSITTDAERHTSSKEEITNSSVFTHVCELKYSTNKRDDMLFATLKTDPKEHFQCEDAAALILNMDYENYHIREKNIPALPDACYTVSKDDKFELMYNITGIPGTSSALLFVAVGDIQQQINGQNFLLFDIHEGETLNGVLNVSIPQEPGSYEVIGYLVFDPTTSVEETMLQIVETSFRFTLIVK